MAKVHDDVGTEVGKIYTCMTSICVDYTVSQCQLSFHYYYVSYLLTNFLSSACYFCFSLSLSDSYMCKTIIVSIKRKKTDLVRSTKQGYKRFSLFPFEAFI